MATTWLPCSPTPTCEDRGCISGVLFAQRRLSRLCAGFSHELTIGAIHLPRLCYPHQAKHGKSPMLGSVSLIKKASSGCPAKITNFTSSPTALIELTTPHQALYTPDSSSACPFWLIVSDNFLSRELAPWGNKAVSSTDATRSLW